MSEWIGVNESLPRTHEVVLVFAEGEIQTACLNRDCDWQGFDYKWIADEVTHWMPLPEPPK